jgi:hypothetical protein
MDSFRRKERAWRRERFWAQHLANLRAWAPDVEIEDLGAEGQGTLLFGRNFGLPQYTSTHKRPTLGP